MERRELSGPPRPLLSGYEDVNLGLTDDCVCSGRAVRLCGHWLRFRRSDPRQGVFLVAEDGTARREEAVTFVGLSQVTFTSSRDLPPGSYWLEVRAVLVPRDGLCNGACCPSQSRSCKTAALRQTQPDLRKASGPRDQRQPACGSKGLGLATKGNRPVVQRQQEFAANPA